MPYEPLVLLHRLAPEDVNHLIRQNHPPPTIINQPHKNAHIFNSNEESNIQPPDKDIIVNHSLSSLENRQELKCSSSTLEVISTNCNVKSFENDNKQQGTFSNERNHEHGLKNHSELQFGDKSKTLSTSINKELVVVIDNDLNGKIRDMVNSTTQHPKTRNPTTLAETHTNTSSSTPTTLNQDSSIAKEHITDESIMIMTTKTSSLSTVTTAIEATDKNSKDISLECYQHISNEEHNKQTIYNNIQYESSGLSLRTRTISSTIVPTAPLLQSIVSTASSVQPINSTLTVSTPRPRGRPPRRKNLNHVAKRKKFQQISSKQAIDSKICDSTLKVIQSESAASSLERLQQQQLIRSYNGLNNFNNEQENSSKNMIPVMDTENKNTTLLSKVNKNKEFNNVNQMCNKKTNGRKRKKSDIEESIAAKRVSIFNNAKDSSSVEKNLINKSLQPDKPNLEVDFVKYGFLANSDIVEPYRQRIYMKVSSNSSIYYGRTYWPTNWEYSANALTSHVQKKASKDTLRKIRLVCGAGQTGNMVTLPQKNNLKLKKYQTSVFQRRANGSKTIAETSNSIQFPSASTIIKRKKGRPPGIKNKLIQAVIKENSPRKSPRQHASTLAAIMSNKSINTDKHGEQNSEVIDVDTELNTNLSDKDGPCKLTIAVPKNELLSEVRHYKRQRLNRQHNVRRGRRCRSITPPPPKLCAQKPAPQRTSINTTIDQEVVKLRTKHVDVIRKRARDERLRTAFVCQQLHKVQELAEQNRHDLALIKNINGDKQDYQFSSNAIILPLENQDQIWSSQIDCDREPDNMCLQIMYEQTGDKRFLCTNLTDETLQLYYQQRDLALNERLTNSYYGDTVTSDLGTDNILASNKRKKKRPNMTGWPKEKRRKILTTATTINTADEDINGNSDIDRNSIVIRRRAKAAKQRFKLKQKKRVPKEKSKVKMVTTIIPKRKARRPGPKKKIKKYRATSVSSNDSIVSCNTNNMISTKSRKKRKVQKPQQKKRIPKQNKTSTDVSVIIDEPNTVVKRKCGRPKGSLGVQKRMKLQMMKRRSRKQMLSPEQQKENVMQQNTSSGKLKCVISTRNNRVKLLSTHSPNATQSLKKTTTGCKTKKSSAVYNLSSSCLETQSSSMAVIGKTTRMAKRKQQMTSTTGTWDVGRPKRYHSTNSRNTNTVEDDCFVGSQPFEQHCPGAGSGLSHNTVLENHQNHFKENTVHDSSL